jgi:hypothetical protein
MKPRYLALAVLGLSLVLPWLPAEQPSAKLIEKPLAKPSVVPFELLKSGHMAVMVKVNGKGPYRVIFDTGAPINLFNNKLARETGLLRGQPQSALPLFGTIGETSVEELQVGTEKAKKQPAIVMDHPLLEVMSQKLGPLYGIVGFPFFARYRMTLDYQAQTMTLVPSGYKPGNTMASLEKTLMSLMLGGPPEPRVLSSAGQWGLVAHKPDGDEDSGVIIQEVLPGTAAAAAGLKPGDRLLTLDDRWTDTLPDLYEAASHIQPGTTVLLRVRRGGTELEVNVTPRAGL